MNTFTKSERLLSKEEFKQVFDTNILTQSKFFSSYILLAKSTKIGIIVAKKHHKLAVQRNTIKRIVREYFRQHNTAFPQVKLIIISKKFSTYHTHILWQDLQSLTARINETYQSISDSSY